MHASKFLPLMPGKVVVHEAKEEAARNALSRPQFNRLGTIKPEPPNVMVVHKMRFPHLYAELQETVDRYYPSAATLPGAVYEATVHAQTSSALRGELDPDSCKPHSRNDTGRPAR